MAAQPTSRAKAIKALNEIVKIDSSVLAEVDRSRLFVAHDC